MPKYISEQKIICATNSKLTKGKQKQFYKVRIVSEYSH